MSERTEGQRPEEQPREEDKLSPERILKMSPKEMVDLFVDLEAKGELEQFLEKSAENDALVAQFSYWEKWLEKDQRRLVDEAIVKKREIYEGEEDKDSLPLHLEERFTEEELKLIFSNTEVIQLTFGCSKGCPFCGLDAVPGVREHISYGQLANLFQRFGKQIGKSKPILYYASEPSDYASKAGLEDKTYQDIHQLAVEYADYDPHITSKETNDDRWLDFLRVTATKNDRESGYSADARVSVYGLSAERIQEIREKTGGKVRFVGGGVKKHTESYGVSFKDGQPVPGLEGESVAENFRSGICSITGFLLTPRGLYQIVDVSLSHDFPQGSIVVPFEKRLNIEIKQGDDLRDVLRCAIITDKRDKNGDPFMSPFFEVEGQHPTYNIFSVPFDKFRKFLEVTTKDGKRYQIWHDEKGVVHRVREINNELISTEQKKEQWKFLKNEENKRKNSEEARKNEERRKARKEEIESKYGKEIEEVSPKVNDIIRRAIFENKVVVEDKHLSKESVSKILTFCQSEGFDFKKSRRNYVHIGDSSDSTERDYIYWMLDLQDIGMEEIDKESKGIDLKVEYSFETGEVSLSIITGRSYDEKTRQDRLQETMEKSKRVNQLFIEAIKSNRVEVCTNYSKGQIRKIIEALSVTDVSLLNIPRWPGDAWTREIEVEKVGRVVVTVKLEEEDRPTLYII